MVDRSEAIRVAPVSSDDCRARLLAGLRAADSLTQVEAARLLGEVGGDWAVDPLAEHAAASRHYTKTVAIESLRRIGARRAAATMRRLVAAPNVPDDWYWHGFRSVRAAAALALLEWGDEFGIPTLEAMAEKGDVVFFVWYAPTILRLPDAISSARKLKERLTPATLCDGAGPAPIPVDPAHWVMVIEALETIGTPVAAEHVQSLLGHFSRYVRGRAVTALAAMVPATGRSLARRLFVEDPAEFTRIQAARALARGGDLPVVNDLERIAMSAGDPFDQAVALRALGEIGDPRRAAPAEAALSHADPWVRQAAVESLPRMGAPSAETAVRHALNDPAPTVRLQAVAALIASDRSDAP